MTMPLSARVNMLRFISLNLWSLINLPVPSRFCSEKWSETARLCCELCREISWPGNHLECPQPDLFSPVDLWVDSLQLDRMTRERPFTVCATITAAEVNWASTVCQALCWVLPTHQPKYWKEHVLSTWTDASSNSNLTILRRCDLGCGGRARPVFPLRLLCRHQFCTMDSSSHADQSHFGGREKYVNNELYWK